MMRQVWMAWGVMLVMPVGIASAQMVFTQTPLQHNGVSFYESSHVSWGLQNPHYFMRFNGGGIPPYGGYQPGAGLRGGFSTGHSHFQFGFGQGATATSSAVTPFLTTTNGYPGSLFIGSQRPFVTGFVPNVGGGFASIPPPGPPMGPLALRVATGQLPTEKGSLKLSDLDAAGIPPAPEPILQIRDVARDAPAPQRTGHSQELSAQDCLDRAIAAEANGKAGVARIFYQLAAARGDAVIKADATRRLQSLGVR